MKVVILAGGLGTRMSEETDLKPKPMVEIGGRPILWHIMKLYSTFGLNDFLICCGFKGYMIKEYFANYLLHVSDVTFDLPSNEMHVHQSFAEPWKITLVDTGELTMTGGRLKRITEYLGDDPFCFTYGDGVGNIDIGRLIKFHMNQGLLATVTAIQPPGRFGAIKLSKNETMVESFEEKPGGDGAWINGGFFVLSPEVIKYIEGDDTKWEEEPMRKLALDGQMAAFIHDGFWQCMDTLRDKKLLETHWATGKAPWKIW